MDSGIVLVAQGAEGKIYESLFLGKPCIIKERMKKNYRVKELDTKLNKQRILQESRCMFRLIIEKIVGRTIKARINALGDSKDFDEILPLVRRLGESIGKMHDIDVVHGDLTTSNIMVRDKDNVIVIIDFGLGQMKSSIEDKAVDLYVLERAFSSTHPGSGPLVSALLESYRFSCRKGTIILGKLEQVRQRGRKREMLG